MPMKSETIGIKLLQTLVKLDVITGRVNQFDCTSVADVERRFVKIKDRCERERVVQPQ
jgi:hypothetical protein